MLVVNLSPGGALVESTLPLQPGARTELQPLGGTLPTLGGCIGRCRVIAIDPMRYEAAVIFDHRLVALG